ncbi:hypothetical protein BGX27_002511 [Mortierella sp. AM989]|nr:hypothetical protein BGX27_002511 [Mortierella sp. AM989]
MVRISIITNNISSLKESRIIEDLYSGRSTRTTAERQGVPQTKVARIEKMHMENIPQQRLVSPSKVSDPTKRLMVRELTNGTLNTAVEIKERLEHDFGVDITTAKVRQIL